MDKALEALTTPLFTVADVTVTTGQLVFVPVVLLLAWLLFHRVDTFVTGKLKNNGADPNLIQLLRRILLIIAIIVVAITTLDFLQVPITAFAFVSGAIAIGVGFGAQNIINNFISGWILMWERPIRIGDFIELNDTRGTVEAINTRSTRIRRVDGVHILVPNSYLLENTVVNWTLIDRLARTEVKVGVAYGSDVQKVQALLMQIMLENADVLKDPKPVVLFQDFGDSCLSFDAIFWVLAGGDRDLRLVRSQLRYRINELFHEHSIVIAFPQRDVHINSVAPLDVRVVGSEHDG